MPPGSGAKSCEYFWLPAGGNGKQRAAVEGIVEGHNLVFLGTELIQRIFARQLQRRFVSFSAGVTEKTLSAKVASISIFAKRSTGSLV